MTPPGDLVLRADDQLLLAGRLRARAALDTTMTEAFTASYVIDGRRGAVELGLAAVRPPELRSRDTVTHEDGDWSARPRRRWPGVVLPGRGGQPGGGSARGCA